MRDETSRVEKDESRTRRDEARRDAKKDKAKNSNHYFSGKKNKFVLSLLFQTIQTQGDNSLP